MDVHFVDTTLRDGSQSLWAMGTRYGMIEPIAADMDRAGFSVIEVPANPIFFKKIVRELKEDPWVLMRMLAQKMPNTVKSTMGGMQNLVSFGGSSPPVVGRLAMQMVADIGALNRVQQTCNTGDQLIRSMPRTVPQWREQGFQVALAISYSISPRHTDELFVEKVRGAVALRPDAIYLKDQGGLLTPERARTLLPLMLEAAGSIPVELHSHCTTGLAPVVYAEALGLGVHFLHTGVPPASDGSAQPSVLDTARNARALGHHPQVDEELLASISTRLASLVRQEGLPFGEPVRYDANQYRHQIPGGVISNLRFQLAEIHLEHRLDEVIEESVRVRADLGYPAMITPYSQYVCTQAAINVAQGERYKTVIDELIRFAQGSGGVDSGYTWMDQDLRDRLVSLPRAQELAARAAQPPEDLTLRQAKERYGSATMSDEELVLRVIMQGSAEVDAMRRAGPPRRYLTADAPLLTLLSELERHPSIRYVHIERGGDRLRVENRAPAPAAR